jgi:DNA-binding NtrC family response regulator
MGAFEIVLPPLRDRLEDLPDLVERFATLAASGDAPHFGEEAIRALAAHRWPRNVRELGNVVARLVLTTRGEVPAADVRRLLGEPRAAGVLPPSLLRERSLADLLALVEREHLVQLHADRGGDLPAMAASLGITVRALYDRFRRLGIRPVDRR